ncbi:DUF3050 domain-containing protein [Chitinophaga sp. SYP-B3965]|uniref:DUF3050 domain-containing protein n=1 Tax=Chitinophaga sp. SYP-B3965 TaxID=2663120 RepID=UPI00129964AB|nr:DUF3050 domain-containing protein [Chitinophaga sp. SYP-B3965]MRG46509.1 DUF3050 domain-containing protein [Chitinophaga sp. SYP-B3965]
MGTKQIEQQIAEVRNRIVEHPLYGQLKTMEDVRLFMEHHVFAVWDFMSLLKGLQQELTCVTTPWVPKGSPETRFLINEIVVGEESDVDASGKRFSHFELYLKAMEQAGADTTAILQLVSGVQQGKPIGALTAKLPPSVKGFLDFTFGVIATGKAHLMAAVFTYGREDLIPDMFYSLVKDLNEQFPGKLDIFVYYLERHIEVDGDHHSILAQQMVLELCGDDETKWEESAIFAMKALEWRNELWNGIVARQEILQ